MLTIETLPDYTENICWDRKDEIRDIYQEMRDFCLSMKPGKMYSVYNELKKRNKYPTFIKYLYKCAIRKNDIDFINVLESATFVTDGDFIIIKLN